MPRLKTPLLAGQRPGLVAIAINPSRRMLSAITVFLFAPEYPAWHCWRPLHMPTKFTEVGIG